jgi:hypothetical protein
VGDGRLRLMGPLYMNLILVLLEIFSFVKLTNWQSNSGLM